MTAKTTCGRTCGRACGKRSDLRWCVACCKITNTQHYHDAPLPTSDLATDRATTPDLRLSKIVLRARCVFWILQPPVAWGAPYLPPKGGVGAPQWQPRNRNLEEVDAS